MTFDCYFRDIGTSFNFGKYKGMPLYYVLKTNPSYIYWCIYHVSSILFSKETIKQIRLLFPSFLLPIDIETCIIDPSEYDNMNNDNYDDNYDDNSIENETPTYERYSGSWAQDEMGFSDDDIDTIFDGDPLAYWNID